MARSAALLLASSIWVVASPTPRVAADEPAKAASHATEARAKAAALGLTLDPDEPPRPVRITRPGYPKAARKARIQGTVVVMIVIDANGRVSEAEVVESKSGLDEAALKCVKGWRFRPAQKAGVPVGTVAMAPVSFRITD